MRRLRGARSIAWMLLAFAALTPGYGRASGLTESLRTASCDITGASSDMIERVPARVSLRGAACPVARRIGAYSPRASDSPEGGTCDAGDVSRRCVRESDALTRSVLFARIPSRRCAPRPVQTVGGAVKPLGIVERDRTRAAVRSCQTALAVTAVVVKALFADAGHVVKVRLGHRTYEVSEAAASAAVARRYGDSDGVTIATAKRGGYTVSIFLGE